MRTAAIRFGAITLAAIASAALVASTVAQHPVWPLSGTEPNSECFASTVRCRVCSDIPNPPGPGDPTTGCDYPQPAAGWQQNPCIGHSGAMGMTCMGTSFDCGMQSDCNIHMSSGIPCYSGPWCR